MSLLLLRGKKHTQHTSRAYRVAVFVLDSVCLTKGAHKAPPQGIPHMSPRQHQPLAAATTPPQHTRHPQDKPHYQAYVAGLSAVCVKLAYRPLCTRHACACVYLFLCCVVCIAVPISTLAAVLVPHDREVLCELVPVFRLQVAAHVLHELVEAGGQVRLLLRGLLQDDLLADLCVGVCNCCVGGVVGNSSECVRVYVCTSGCERERVCEGN